MGNDKFVLPQEWDVIMFKSVRDGVVKLEQETVIEVTNGYEGCKTVVYTYHYTVTVDFDNDGNPNQPITHRNENWSDAEIIEIWRRTSADVMTCVYRYHKPVIQDIETFANTFRRYD